MKEFIGSGLYGQRRTLIQLLLKQNVFVNLLKHKYITNLKLFFFYQKPLFIFVSVNSESIAHVIAHPALGPSLGVAPSGQCICKP